MIENNRKKTTFELVFYHQTSFGGTFSYAINSFEAFAKQHISSELLLPRNVSDSEISKKIGNSKFSVNRILLTDQPNTKIRLFKQLHFVFRSLINPFILWNFIRKKKKLVVVFNEFDQFSAIIWGLFFRIFKKNGHCYAVILHDPDRNNYFKIKKLSEISMKSVMQIIDVAFYHEIIPERNYYQNNGKTIFRNIAHGVYPKYNADEKFREKLILQKADSKLFIMPGNIRSEKNYHLAIEALAFFPDVKLLIAGKSANSGIQTAEYKKLSVKNNTHNRIIWREHFLSNEQMAAAIEISDLVLLPYSESFKSQSGGLFLVAPYRKPLLVSEGESALAIHVKRFNLGICVQPDSLEGLKQGFSLFLNEKNTSPDWEAFFNFASWNNSAKLALETFEDYFF